MFKKGFLAFFAAALFMANGSVAEAAEITAIQEVQVVETSVSGGDAYVGMVEETVPESGTVEVEVMSTSTDLTISSNYTLTEDTSVAGDLTITAGTVNLNGYTLTVGGDVIFTAGTLDINEGKLDIAGNFSMGSMGAISGSQRSATSTGVLVMDGASDVVIVDGNYEICNGYRSTLTKGTMYIGGNLTQYGAYYTGTYAPYANAYSFSASGSHKVVFTDNASHRIFFESSYSGFCKVDFGNGDIEIVNAIRGFQLEEDATWSLKESANDLAMGETMDLNGHTLTIKGNMNLTSGIIDLNKGCLDVKGNLSLGTMGSYSGSQRSATSCATLVMDNEEDRLMVDGDFEIGSCYQSTLSNGIMYINGDFAQYGNYYTGTYAPWATAYAFNASGSHKVIFSDDVNHSIYFEQPYYSGFSRVDFGNGVIEITNGIRGFILEEDTEWTLKLPSDSLGITNTLDLDGHNLVINNSVNLTSGTVKFNGGCLEVKGNFSLGIEDNVISNTQNATSSAILVMDDELDKLVVDGDFEVCSCYRSTLSDGTMYIGGDFAQYGNYVSGTYAQYATAYSFNASGSHKVIFSNDAAHNIYFEYPYYSGFSRVDFGNGVITVANGLRGLTLEEDTEWTLKQPSDCIGFINTWDLNGYSLTINGNVNLTAGVLDFNEGCLKVNGDFSLGKKGDSRDATSSARMIMEYEKDTLIVSGDFSICSNYESTLNAGIFYLSGDFAQYGNSALKNGYSPATGYSFRACEPHKVVLCGDKPQSVLFEGVGYARFGIVEFHMPTENYTFNPNGQCWQTLIPYSTVQVRNFVERMYTVALNRASDPSGVAYWTEQLIAKDYDGASLSASFILGPEFTGKNYSNDEFVKVLYSTFFSREADDAGKAYWSGLLESGSNRATVLAGFVNSNEFFALCGEYGISRGVLRSDGSAVNPGIYQFAERLYSKIFERNGDKDGIEYWTMQIDSRESTPESAAMGFFFSPEYVEKNTSDDDYIKALYRTFMGREADDAGLTYWKGEMANGATRAHVLSSFAQSNEFKEIMAEYGL